MLRRLIDWAIGRKDEPLADDKWSIPQDWQSGSGVANTLSGKIRIPLKGNGNFSFNIVGEASYQDALLKLAGKKTREGKEVACKAEISLEPENPHDSNAVVVKIERTVVGYFSRPDAKDYSSQVKLSGGPGQPRVVSALIVGGFKNKDREGHFGVKLDITRHR